MSHPMDDLERMEDAWNRMSADYGQRLSLSPTDEKYAALAAQIQKTPETVFILDLGCGLGFELDAILARVPNSHITCVDLSAQMLVRLRERLSAYSPQISTVHQSYVDYAFPHQTFDYVVSSLTVHHLPYQTKKALYSNILRSLKRSGSYLELDIVASEEQQQIGQKLYDEFVANRNGGEQGEWNHNMPFTQQRQVQLLQEVGFSSVSVVWSATYAEVSGGEAVFQASSGV